MATHKEKDLLIKTLKQKVLSLENKTAELIPSKTSNLNETGVSLVKINGEFSLVILKFDPETKEAKVEVVDNLGKNFNVSTYAANAFLHKDIIDKLGR